MFGTVLDKLSALLSKSFVISSFFPVLIFAGANGLMLYFLSASFRKFLRDQYDPSLGTKAAVLLVTLSILAVVAFLLSSLNLPLREILEGRYWPKHFRQWGQGRHIRQMDDIQEQYTKAQSNRTDLDRFSKEMGASLIEARRRGSGKHGFTQAKTAENLVKGLLDKRNHGKDIPNEELNKTVDELAHALENADADIIDPGPYFTASEELDRSHQDLLRAWKYMDDRRRTEAIQLYKNLHSNFAFDEVAATAMGNTAIAARDYAESRYGLDLDAFWSRLQKVVQQDEKFYSVLQDAKTQLDFLISMFWLTTLFCLLWAIALPCIGRGCWQFFLIMSVGPWIAAAFYALAVQNYHAFADVLRSSVDLFRMQLLSQLHISLPVRAEEEPALWTSLGDRINYDKHDKNMTFAHPPTP